MCREHANPTPPANFVGCVCSRERARRHDDGVSCDVQTICIDARFRNVDVVLRAANGIGQVTRGCCRLRIRITPLQRRLLEERRDRHGELPRALGVELQRAFTT